MDQLVTGTRLGNFEVESLLGVGGMASVYRAHQVSLDRRVALKVLAPALVADASFVVRFQREGVHLARLEHEAIVSVYEAGRHDHHLFLAMQLIEGTTLKGLMAERAPLAPNEVLALLKRVADALDYAHGQGFVHRDVKPANILIGRDGRSYLSDFGITKVADDPALTATGHGLGSPAYLAPEQAAGGPVDGRTDVYALGCVAFECLTGFPPYRETDPAALLLAHASAPIPSASDNNPALSSRVDAVLRKALAKEPSNRYDSAIAFIGDLTAAIDETAGTSQRLAPRVTSSNEDSPQPGQLSSTREPGERVKGLSVALRRHRLLAVAAVAVLVLGVGAVIGLLVARGGNGSGSAANQIHSASSSNHKQSSAKGPTLPSAASSTTAAPPAAPYASISGPADVCDGTAAAGPSYTYTGNLGPTVVSGYWLDASGGRVSNDPHSATYGYFFGTGYSKVTLVVSNSVGQSYTATLSVYSHPC